MLYGTAATGSGVGPDSPSNESPVLSIIVIALIIAIMAVAIVPGMVIATC